MSQERNRDDQKGSAEARLARLLRSWWLEAERPGSARPTQQALAFKLGIDQTTLSRYLNPNNSLTAPLRMVEALHAQLGPPAQELEWARDLCRAASRENVRHQAGGAEGAATLQHHYVATVAAAAGDAQPSSSWPRSWWSLALATVALGLAFAAGAAVNDGFFTSPRSAVTGGTDGSDDAASLSETSYVWPLLYMRAEDQYTRCRVLQYLLRARGYTVRTDGFFRQDTHDAVMDFQLKTQLPVDGKVGVQTWPELVRDVGPGSGSFEVRAVQELLNNVGQGGTTVSGRFTAATAEDVKHFQRTERLSVSGRVDTNTWLALLVKQRPPVKAPAYQRSASPWASPSA
ncbi:peptidoglycan-binding protein [Streptomyces sp. NPDC020412]|uniref:peptidoglycan-binding protein n=1 Tax=Streptomyces sp. NPDC020412 TaxID=3365073 RepID=UPI0037B733FF